MKKGITLLFILFFYQIGYTQTVYSIKNDLLKLKNTTTILYVAAHPDDENNLLIGYLAKGKHYRTIYYSLTRGDGGQNLIGSEQSLELGLLRTEELLKARSVDGGEQYFSHAYDFGFSKTAKETFEHWDEGLLLKDLIQAIRITQPDVIICRFPADKRAGHGHHIASAMLARMAYNLAGDEHYKLYSNPDLKPWRANALLWNVFNKNDSLLKVPLLQLKIAGIDSSSGKTFQELAADSRSMHKCQGFGVAPDNNNTEESFEIIEGGSNAANLNLNSITNQKWSTEKNGKEILKSIDDLISNEQRYTFETSLNKLFALRNQIKNINDSLIRAEKLNMIDGIILKYSKLRISFYSKDEIQTIQHAFTFDATIFNPEADKTFEIIIDGNLIPITPLTNYHQTVKTISNNTSQPIWLKNEIKNDLYDYDNNGLVSGKSKNDLTYPIQIVWKKDTITYNYPIQFQKINPKSGEEISNLIIADGVYTNDYSNAIYFQNAKSKSVTITLVNPFEGPYVCKMVPELSSNDYSINPTNSEIKFSKKSEVQSITFEIIKKDFADNSNLSFEIEDKQSKYKLDELREINYPHIEKQHYFKPVAIKLINPTYKIASKKVAYLMGSGDKIPEVLQKLGIMVDVIQEKDLSKLDFNDYKVVIAGIRLYNTSKEIHQLNDKINQYIYNGGKYIVQYNTAKEVEIGPYDFKVGKSRVTEEHSTVSIKDSSCIELNYPNKITTVDFNNWIQERGIYFVESPSSNFITPLSMNDTKENPHTGSLIIANYGKGKFIYTGLSFFRQLPAHVDGATKLFLNLIAE